MSHFDVYAIGNALVDTEYRVTDDFLSRQGIAKGMMTLIDEPQQQKLLSALDSESVPVAARRPIPSLLWMLLVGRAFTPAK